MVCQDSESDTQCKDGGKCINSKCQESCSMTSPNVTPSKVTTAKRTKIVFQAIVM